MEASNSLAKSNLAVLNTTIPRLYWLALRAAYASLVQSATRLSFGVEPDSNELLARLIRCLIGRYWSVGCKKWRGGTLSCKRYPAAAARVAVRTQ
jgi:hypothetical protein